MADSIQVLYETRNHAKGAFTSNYPPLQQDEGAKGGFLSYLSLSAVKQLKEKWGESRNPKRFKKWTSLYVSPSGEHVAVASGNKITILRKDDDYEKPCGVFIGQTRNCTFTHGAWSDYHQVLGVIDETDTIYFIKANGEEITQITKKQLKVTVPIIGLIVLGDPEDKTSCFCTFSVITSDGLIHHVEVGREPSASISSINTSNKRLTLKNQLSQGVSCLDYHPEHSLLVVVGSPISIKGNSKDGSGLYCISLWRKTSNLDLEPVVSSPQCEGLINIPKGYEGPVTTPKVLVSPQSKYIAVLDLTGKLDVFKVDDEKSSLSVIAFDGRRNCLNAIADFTWWSDRILLLAKMSGVVTMLDVLSDNKLLENDLAFSMPVLERGQQCQGCIFLVECLSAEETDSHIPAVERGKSEDGDSKGIDYRLNQLDVGKLNWSLISFSEKSVSGMYSSLISNQQYEAAMDFANRHGLDRDDVLKSQWLHSNQGTKEINIILSSIKDQDFVLSECLEKIGPTEEAAKSLLSYGLRVTDKYRFSELEDSEPGKCWDFRMGRLQLLQFKDRLETFIGINMGRFSVQEYNKFRITPLNEAAVALAESGKIGALNLLFKRHPYSLSPFMLKILAAIPETIPVQTYGQLLPGRSPPTTIVLREEDWVECEKMVSFINKMTADEFRKIPVQTESIMKQHMGLQWPSADELSLWYKTRARDIDSASGQLDNSLYLVEFACRKGISELQSFNEEISYLYQLIYSDEIDEEEHFTISLVSWEQLSDYEKFKMMISRVKDDKVLERLRDKAIPFMRNSSLFMASASEDPLIGDRRTESFLVRWLKEMASDNKLDICSTVIEDGCGDFQVDDIFLDEVEAVECALQCIYLCSLTDRWNTMASILSKLPKIKDNSIYADSLGKRVQIAEGHVEVGRLLAYYQVPKPITFLHDAHSDEKAVKQILRLILSKFGRRQPGRADNEWASMWRDMQRFQEKAFPFLEAEYMLMEFCRGLLKAGKFSLARNYLKGTATVALAADKAENLVVQAAREYFFSASSLSSPEIWKAKECLNIFPNSRNVKAEADIIDALTVNLPNLGVTLLPVQFRQIKNPMEIINMVITSQASAYLNLDELIEVAKLLGLNSQDDIAAVQEAVAREAAVAGDLQLAFDLCLVLAKKGHGPIWDLCAAIARGPFLDNMDTSSRKELLGFSLCHCDEESITELLHAWKDLDMQSQCETLQNMSGSSPNLSDQGSSAFSLPAHGNQDIASVTHGSVEVANNDDQAVYLKNVKNVLVSIAKDLSDKNGTDWETLLENGKVLSFAAAELPWMLELSRKEEFRKKMTSDANPPVKKRYTTVRTQALVTILSWLARNDIAPTDGLVADLAKSIMETPVTEDEDILGCSVLLNLGDAFHGAQIIEELLKTREGYQEICSIMNMGMSYSSLNNSGIDRADPTKRRELLLQKFQEKQSPLSPDAMGDKVQSTFWRVWKSKLEEQKLLTDQSRQLENILPGVDTARFLSQDSKYIEDSVYSVIDSVKVEKKSILEEVLKLADTYALSRTNVVLRFLGSVLVSEVWENDDIVSEISEHNVEILSSAASLVSTIYSNVYPAIDGCNKQRLSYIFSILSDCYLHLEGSEYPLLDIHSETVDSHIPEFAEYYKILDQECKRVSFINSLNFKNVAGLGGLNIECFNEEVYSHIDEFNVEALAEMVRTLVSFFPDSASKGIISWQSVYKHHIRNTLTSFVTAYKTNIDFSDPENFEGFVSELQRIYSVVRNYIRSLSQEDVLEITQQYYITSFPINWLSGNLPDESEWMNCLILLLKFWISLTNDVYDAVCYDNSEGKLVKFNAECQSKCLKVFIELLTEVKVSVYQGWLTVSHYIRNVPGGFTGGIFKLCRAMMLSGCGFEAISLVFSEVIAHNLTSASSGLDGSGDPDGMIDLPRLYVSILDAVLLDLVNESRDRQNLHNLLWTLSKLDGNQEDLKMVRHAVWGTLATFSDNMQLKNHVRVYVLELMQSITGRNLKGLHSELVFNVQPWEGWDESFSSGSINDYPNQGAPNRADSSSRFASNLVALKSTQLAAIISPSIEITPDDLATVELAVSCFTNLSATANTDAHFEALQNVLEEWEGIFITENKKDDKNQEDPGEASDVGNDNWSGDEWDEGWESFQEEQQPVEKHEKKEKVISVHPLHTCWMEISKKLISLNQFANVFKMIDRSSSTSNLILLNEEETRELSQVAMRIDHLIALKLVLLLPYQAIHIQCLEAVEDELKQRGSFDRAGSDPEILTLILSSGIIPTIFSNSKYTTIFTYICYSLGQLSCLCQESQLPELKSRGAETSRADESDLIIFRTLLFPSFVSELVKARQPVLAGFLVSRSMHTSASLSLINVAEPSLRRYLEGQIRVQQGFDYLDRGKTGMCRYLGNTVSGLRSSLGSLTQSALSSLLS